MNTHAVPPPPAQNLGDATDSKNSSSRIRLAELGKMFRGELWSIPHAVQGDIVGISQRRLVQEKTGMLPHNDTDDDMFSRFKTVHECDGRTDGRTLLAQNARACM